MRDGEDSFDAPGEDLPPSKSEIKRRMLALQELGEALVALNDKQLARIPVEDDRLSEAIREARAIRSNSARRRHLQFIGKLMRDIDPGPIRRALQEMHQRHEQDKESFHLLEQLRDEILETGVAGVEQAMARWPEADRQQLRQLVLQHQREQQRGKPPAASRKLFRYLRELHESHRSG
jgi:ribosome-associated protein